MTSQRHQCRPCAASPAPDGHTARQSELDYYECVARYGHNSAEAYVAHVCWQRLKSQGRK